MIGILRTFPHSRHVRVRCVLLLFLTLVLQVLPGINIAPHPLQIHLDISLGNLIPTFCVILLAILIHRLARSGLESTTSSDLFQRIFTLSNATSLECGLCRFFGFTVIIPDEQELCHTSYIVFSSLSNG
jgi:hypothetical protein